jgi:hypothetical protein
VIVRLMGEGQYRIDEGLRAQLNELDDQAVTAIDAEDEPSLDKFLDEMWELVQERGQRLPDEEIATSDLIIPPSDLTLEETRKLFTDEGLVPDLPAR